MNFVTIIYDLCCSSMITMNNGTSSINIFNRLVIKNAEEVTICVKDYHIGSIGWQSCKGRLCIHASKNFKTCFFIFFFPLFNPPLVFHHVHVVSGYSLFCACSLALTSKTHFFHSFIFSVCTCGAVSTHLAYVVMVIFATFYLTPSLSLSLPPSLPPSLS